MNTSIPLGLVGHVYAGTGTGAYASVLAIFLAFWLVGVTLFWRNRHFQPLRARESTFWLAGVTLPLPAVIVFLIRGELGDLTGTCWTSWLMANLIGPTVVIPFELGTLGLVYIYEVNLEKLSRKKGFWGRHVNLFFSSWFRGVVIAVFLVVQIVLTLLVQHGTLLGDPDRCTLLAPVAMIPLFAIYALIFLFIIYKLYKVDDIFMMRYEFVAIFFVTVTCVVVWITCTVLQNSGVITGQFFTTILIVAGPISNTLTRLYHPLYQLFFTEPWRSMYNRAKNSGRSSSETQSVLEDGLTLMSLPRDRSGAAASVVEESGDFEAIDNGDDDGHHMPSNSALALSSDTIDLKEDKIEAINVTTADNRAITNITRTAHLKAYLMDPVYTESFKQYCVRSFCVESILFYLDARDAILLSAVRTTAEQEDVVATIIKNYLLHGADYEINISQQTRDSIVQQYKTTKDDPRIFRVAIAEVYHLLKTNIFAKWVASHEFQRVRLIHANPVDLRRHSQYHSNV